MTAMQRIRQDGWGKRGIALALIYLVMLAGMSQGALAAANAGPLPVICSASGTSAVRHAPDSSLPDHEAMRWHCATLCQVSSAGAPIVLDAQADFIPLPQAGAPAVFLASAEIFRSSIQRLIAEARAPPFSI